MESIFEVIVALVIGAFWLFGSSPFKNREEAPEPRQRRKRTAESSDDEVRQREVREAIRRKIEERRQQQNSPEPVPAPASGSPLQDPFELTLEQPETSEEPTVYSKPASNEVAEDGFYQNVEVNTYEQQMQGRLEAIEATKKQAEALKQQLGKNTGDVDPIKGIPELQKASFHRSLRSTLKNPRSLRTAFLCKEVLGTPVGLKNYEVL